MTIVGSYSALVCPIGFVVHRLASLADLGDHTPSSIFAMRMRAVGAAILAQGEVFGMTPDHRAAERMSSSATLQSIAPADARCGRVPQGAAVHSAGQASATRSFLGQGVPTIVGIACSAYVALPLRLPSGLTPMCVSLVRLRVLPFFRFFRPPPPFC